MGELYKIILTSAVVAFFYFFIATTVDTGYIDIKYKAFASVFLIFFVLSISDEWYGVLIALVELILTLISLSVMVTWATDDILDARYGAIQSGAFQIELLILCTAFFTWLYQYARSTYHRDHHRDSHSIRQNRNRAV